MLQGASPRSPIMNWLPVAASFRDDLRAALDEAKPGDGLSNGWLRSPPIGSGFWRRFSSTARWRDWI